MKQTTHLTDQLSGNIKFLNSSLTINGKPGLIAYEAEPADPLEAKLAELVPVCLGHSSPGFMV